MRKLLARASVTGFMPCRSADCGKPNKPPYKTINRVIVLCLAWDSQTIKGNFPASLRPFYKDRLLRFGAELVFAICAAKNVEVVILNQGEDTTFEEDLAQDVRDHHGVQCPALWKPLAFAIL